MFAFFLKSHRLNAMFRNIFGKWPLVMAYDRLKIRLAKIFVKIIRRKAV